MKRRSGAAAQTLGEGQYDLIRPKQDKTISVLDYVKLRKSGWLVSPVVDGYLDNIRLLGMDPLTLPSSFLFSNANLTSSISGNDFFEVLTNENTSKNFGPNVKVIIDKNVAPGMAVGEVQKLLNKNSITYLKPYTTFRTNRISIISIINTEQMDLSHYFKLHTIIDGPLRYGSMGVSLRTLIISVTMYDFSNWCGFRDSYLIAGFLLQSNLAAYTAQIFLVQLRVTIIFFVY